MNYIPKSDITFGDLFAGGGGVTTGALSLPGVKVLWALNHDPVSIATHEKNHPETRHFQADIRQQDEKELDRVDILWASLECTQFSNAKGGKPKDADSRTLADEMPRYVKHCNPSVFMIENVREFLTWGPLDDNGKPIKSKKGDDFRRWIKEMKDLGYPNCEWRILNAADYGCHTRRERLFIIFTKKDIPIRWKSATHHPDAENLLGLPQWKPVKECIDLENHGRSIFGRTKPLSENTLRRIAGGIKKFYPDMYFLMKYYGTGENVTSINEPCHTVTTKDRHALVSIERKKFLVEYYGRDDATASIEKPCHVISTNNRHALCTVEKKQFITDHVWGGQSQLVEKPLKTQMTRQTKQLITCQFVSEQYNSNGNPEMNNKSLERPAGSITTNDKFQFVTAYFDTVKDRCIEQYPVLDFDISMRFLTPEELAEISGFPRGYFNHNELKLSWKSKVKMIGNAVPTGLAAATIEPMIPEVERVKLGLVA